MFTSLNQTIRDTQTFQEQIICNKQPTQNSHLTRKDYVDRQINTKADLTTKSRQTFNGRIQIPDFNQASHSGSDIVNLKYINDIFL